MERTISLINFRVPELHTNAYGFARSLLALSTLLTLLFNDTNILFAESVELTPPTCQGLSQISIFCLLKPNLEVARWISIFILLIIISGWRPKLTSIFHWWIAFSLNSTALILDGGDQVATVLTLLLLPLALTDSRKWVWSINKKPIDNHFTTETSSFISFAGLLLIKVQVAVIYFDASIEKFKVDEWLNGTALYYWFTNTYMGATESIKYILNPFITNYITTPILTWSVLLFEMILFLAVVMETKYRKKIMIVGILFHFVIALIHGLFPFFLSMAGALILYLWPLQEEFSFLSKQTNKKLIKLQSV